MTNTLTPGEHNARSRAAKVQCLANQDYIGAIEAKLTRTLRADGTPCPNFIDWRLDYPAQDQVEALHRSLALAYSVQNRTVMSHAERATAYDAFVAYDNALAVAA